MELRNPPPTGLHTSPAGTIAEPMRRWAVEIGYEEGLPCARIIFLYSDAYLRKCLGAVK